MAFQRSLDVGRAGEGYVAGLLAAAGIESRPNAERSKNRLIEWDLECDLAGRTFRIEIKFDVMAARTGNIAIEHYNTRLCKPSGIAATTADLWACVLAGPAAFVCRTADLRKFVADTKPTRHISSGGDGNAALMLYAQDIILPAVFRPLHGLGPDAVKTLLTELLS